MVNLNAHSGLASLYRYFYLTTKLPKFLCDYIYRVLFMFICLPFVWMVILINKSQNKIQFNTHTNEYELEWNPLPTVIGIVFTLGIVIIGIFGSVLFKGIFRIELVDTESIKNTPLLYVIGLISVILSVVFFFIVNGITYIVSKLKIKTKIDVKINLNKKYKFLSLLWYKFSSFRRKKCVIITWEYSKEKEKK